MVVYTERFLSGGQTHCDPIPLAHEIRLYQVERVLLIGKDEAAQRRIGGEIGL